MVSFKVISFLKKNSATYSILNFIIGIINKKWKNVDERVSIRVGMCAAGIHQYIHPMSN